jgi:phosphopantothenoylcysteine decarboxylase/phosphopantothenate--cysteine ligase
MLKSEKPPVSVNMSSANILLLMSGSIACAKATSLISEWTRLGYKVRVACTRSVAEFVGVSTLQGLGAETVFDDVFATGQAMEHISLGKWADVVVAAPATSNLINKFSAGIADDAVTTLWQAAYGQEKPLVIVPAMNTRMWRYPATQESIKRLKQWGVHVLPVASGELACGETGEGRMLEPTQILKMLERLLAFEQPVVARRILVTAGGTREPIDSVRFIGNTSSGRTAASLVDQLSKLGHTVTWLGADYAIQPELANRLEFYTSFEQLEQQLRNLLGSGEYDVVIHAAAVSDFSVAGIEPGEGGVQKNAGGKLSSESDLVLRLKPNPKLLNSLKDWAGNPDLQVIGFKLTDTGDPQRALAAVTKQLERSSVDAVVHNDLADISEAGHSFRLHTTGREPYMCENSEALADEINKLMEVVL